MNRLIVFTNIAQEYLRLHHLQYRVLKISGEISEAHLASFGGPPFRPSKISLWVDMYVPATLI